MRVKTGLICLAVAIAGAAYLLAGKPSRETSKEGALETPTAKVALGNITRVLRLSGQTSAREYRNITAPQLKGPETSSAIVLMKLAKPGAPVRKGQLIALVDGQSTKDHVDDVADLVRQADADIRKRKSEQDVEWETLQQIIRQAKAAMDKAKLDVKTTALLTDIERELLELNAEETAARHKQLLQDLGFHRAAYGAELRILTLTKERQQRHHDRHAHDLQAFTIYAPLDGLAVMTQIWRGGEMGQVQEGDQVSPGQNFMKVVNPATMQLEAKANQAESSGLRVGQKVKIRLDAFPGLLFGGHVYSIGALAAAGWSNSVWVRNVPVNVLIDGADPRVIPDLSASGEVQIAHAENVLTVPMSAVRLAAGKPTVSVKRGDAFEDRPVTLGVNDGRLVAVTSGLQAGDEVRLN